MEKRTLRTSQSMIADQLYPSNDLVMSGLEEADLKRRVRIAVMKRDEGSQMPC